MHRTEYPSEIIERIIQRRGKLHIVDRIQASRAALLVIDMQKAYLTPPSRIDNLEDIVPTINLLASRLREHGGTVMWIKNTLQDSTSPSWPTYAKLRSDSFFNKTRSMLTEGTSTHDLIDGLQVYGSDIVEKKYRYSAFTEESPQIEAALRRRNIETIIITGTVTNVCCETTARDAMMKNFDTIMVSDANVARTDSEHIQSLLNVWQFFGDVMTAEEVTERLF